MYSLALVYLASIHRTHYPLSNPEFETYDVGVLAASYRNKNDFAMTQIENMKFKRYQKPFLKKVWDIDGVMFNTSLVTNAEHT